MRKALDQQRARRRAFGRLFAPVVTFVAAPPDKLARDPARIGLQRHLARIAIAQARQMRAHVQQQGHARMQHVGHGRIHPFHRWPGARGDVGGAVRKLCAHRPRRAEGCKRVADLRSRQGCVMRHALAPVQRPTQRLHQFTRQTKGHVKTAHPGRKLPKALRKTLEIIEPFKPQHAYLALGNVQLAARQHDGLAARRAAGEVAADERRVRGQGLHQPNPSAVTPTAISTAPAMRAARSPSLSKWPPISAANSIDTSRAGATCDIGACCIA
ncbi:hypothetical protein SDC9_96612 [bioreactor metagenome]|uniref:Uncharacterized protein n=1 Tax=bioreactor metagenome TaxID=1076179 RepID=A0A645AB06_9ZZZZ